MASSPILRTPRLLLRALRYEDEEALFVEWNDPRVRKFLWDDKPVPRRDVKEQIELSDESFRSSGLGLFGLFLLPDTETLIGFAGLRSLGESRAVELLYGLAPAYWSRGLATEAGDAVLEYAFRRLGLEEVLAGADPGNEASFRVMERLGMSAHREDFLAGRPVRYYRLRKRDYSRSRLLRPAERS